MDEELKTVSFVFFATVLKSKTSFSTIYPYNNKFYFYIHLGHYNEKYSFMQYPRNQNGFSILGNAVVFPLFIKGYSLLRLHVFNIYGIIPQNIFYIICLLRQNVRKSINSDVHKHPTRFISRFLRYCRADAVRYSSCSMLFRDSPSSNPSIKHISVTSQAFSNASARISCSASGSL